MHSLLPPSSLNRGMRRALRVGDLARETGKTVRALHLYEELGLLEPIERSKGGYRLYDSDAVVRVRWITKLQDMGFSLTDIRQIHEDWQAQGSASAPAAMARLLSVYREKLVETRAQVSRLRALEAELEESLTYLETCEHTCDPNRAHDSCGHCELHADAARPELISGLTAHS